MKTWHIITSEYPPDVGGVSDYTRQVAEALAHLGDEVHVWCPRAAENGITGLHIHSDLGGITPSDLRRVSGLLDTFARPRRLLVQWVPHGFGYRSMNLWFCLWLARRAWSGDRVEVMVHEPYAEFSRGPLRYAVMACVHRLMTIVLLAAAHKMWISIPAWESCLRPYAFGRRVPMEWLPIPSAVGTGDGGAVAAVRLKYVNDGRFLLGHFGSYGSDISRLLEERLQPVMDGSLAPSLLLLGAESGRFRQQLLTRHPSWSARVHAAGYVAPASLGVHIAACDVFVQPYPDGITSRRTSAMACLSQAKPVVTTTGHLTEALWAETGAVLLADVADRSAFASAVSFLLGDERARKDLSRRGHQIYVERFTVGRVVDALRAA